MTGLTRKQALALTRWTPETLRNRVKAGVLHPDRVGSFWLYDAIEFFKTSEDAKEALEELLHITTQSEGGSHFTEAFRRWMDLEQAGLIRVHRPVHEATNIQYSNQYWTVELTEQGMAIAKDLSELIEDGYFL
jgi:hypothetical protein